ncbi:MAG: SDR family NAD(P)-dependent oxidoreductase [Ignavibacteriae bacterium]|nr:MAG: SDR family NAD(P)-dependent oxidoreductase [Ignavibacteriota bacterium]
MNYYYITGTSRGIGKAITEHLLEDEKNFVIGISRASTIFTHNYKHFPLDLSDVDAVKAFDFEHHDDAKKIVLINNAGDIIEIKRAGHHRDSTIIDSMNINLTSALILINKFMKTYSDVTGKKIIVNVSSGAGKHPVDAWSAYCAAKAGLDMFSQVVAEEQKITGGDFKIFSVAPGVVDTKMQEQLRKTDKNEFSRVDDFIEYKEKGKLYEPEFVASVFADIINNANKIDEVIFSVSDYAKSKSTKVKPKKEKKKS